MALAEILICALLLCSLCHSITWSLSSTSSSRTSQASTHKKVTLAYGTWRDNFVVVHKPSGVPLMDEEGRDCLEQRISRELEETLGSVQRESRAIIFPHRIDKWVSGLQVVALDHTTAKLLQRSLRRHLWHKRYRALVQLPPGCSPDDQSAFSLWT